MANLVPSNIVGDPKKIPSEMVKLVPSTVVKGTGKGVQDNLE